MIKLNITINAYINATLKNKTNVDGQINKVDENGFFIDDNITGDIFFVSFEEIERVNEYMQ